MTVYAYTHTTEKLTVSSILRLSSEIKRNCNQTYVYAYKYVCMYVCMHACIHAVTLNQACRPVTGDSTYLPPKAIYSHEICDWLCKNHP